jgi:predicted permease
VSGLTRRLLLRLLGLEDDAADGDRDAPREAVDDWAREMVEALDEERRALAERTGERAAARWHLRQVLAPPTLGFAWRVRRRRRAACHQEGGGRMRLGSARRWWEGTGTDLRQATRGLLREPRLVLFVTATLALGIGANAALFGVADRLFLRGPEHVERPEQLVRIYLEVDGGHGGAARTSPWIPWLTVRAIQDGTSAFSGTTAYQVQEALLAVGTVLRPMRVAMVDAGYFDLLRPVPAAGRFFGGGREAPEEGVVVLSWDLWTSAFGQSSDAVGRTFTFLGRPHTIVGVAPRGFAGPHLDRVDLWLPLDPERAGTRNWYLLGRLAGGRTDGGTLERVAVEADAVHRRTDPGRSFQWARDGRIVALPRTADESGKEPAEVAVARMLLAIGSLVLLIGLANVVNLLLARLTRRRREVAVRLALGGGRWRLARLHLTESLLLGALGGLASLPVAWAGSTVLRSVLLPHVAWSTPPLSWRVVGVSVAVSLTAGLLLAVLPSHRAVREDVARALRGQGSSPGRTSVRLHMALASAQVTLAAALLVGAGLFLESFRTLRVTDLGVDAGRVAALQLRSLDPRAIPSPSDEEHELYRRALDVALRDPGVERAALALGVPFIHGFGRSVSVPGVDSIPELPGGGPWLTAVTADYFATAGTAVVRGRGFSEAEVDGDELVIVVSETMAATLWPGADPLGRCVRVGGVEDPCRRVIGVVEDVHRVGYREPPSLQYYLPMGPPGGFGGMALLVRARDASTTVERLRRALVDQDAAVDWVQAESLAEVLAPQVRPWRLGSWVLGMAALLAVLVSATGVYGVLSYLVEQRRKEIGVRMALGASARSVRGLVLRNGVSATGLGLVVGVGLVAASGRWIEPLLFETSVMEPVVLLAVTTLLLGAALAACLLPARRASRMDPVRSLTSE